MTHLSVKSVRPFSASDRGEEASGRDGEEGTGATGGDTGHVRTV